MYENMLWLSLKKNIYIICLIFTILLIVNPGFAAKTNPDISPLKVEKKLKVATQNLEPFSFKENGKIVGFSIDLWEEIAREMDLNYEFVFVENVVELLKTVRNGEADIGISATTITAEREAINDFSHSVFNSGLQIMVRAGNSSATKDIISMVLKAILSPTLLYVIGIFVFILLVAAHFIWWFERGKNPLFPESYLKGIWEGFWWAGVTITTVGYGDRTPQRPFGRAFALLWMFAGYFILASFTATITSIVTVKNLNSQITSIEDLNNKLVATGARQSTSGIYLEKMGIHAKHFLILSEAFKELENGNVDAVVYDAPVLKYYATHKARGKVEVVGRKFAEQNYGIVLNMDNAFRKQLNLNILKMKENGVYERLYLKWFE